MVGITIGNKHTYRDWGLKLLSFSVSLPERQKNLLQIPGRNGLVDASLPEQREAYKAREMKFVCDSLDKDYAEWSNLLSDIANYVQDERLPIVPDFDKDYFYEGWVSLEPAKSNKLTSKLTFKVKVDPHKMKKEITVVETIVNGATEIVLHNEKMKVSPTLITDNEVTIRIGDTFQKTYAAGEYAYPGFILGKGDTILEIVGNGIVRFEYREGKL